jgi:hypothetical protein
VKAFFGEVGLSREIEGAGLYLQTFLDACNDNGLSVFIYAFRDPGWF